MIAGPLTIMDAEREKHELRELCALFKRTIKQQADMVPFDDCAARVRVGLLIGQAAIQGSEFAYLDPPAPRKTST